MPLACAAPSALHICTAIASTCSGVIGPRAIASVSDSPDRYSMMKYGWPSVRLAEVEDLDDVLVRDHVDRARLVEEAGDDVRVARQHRVQQLDRDLAAEDGVLGEVDDAHSALAQKARDAVVPDRVVNQAGIRGGHDRDPLNLDAAAGKI